MARPSAHLINALRAAAEKLSTGERYEWGHFGSCNCGHLAQCLTGLSKGEIHAYAMQSRSLGDWGEHVRAYCDQSQMPMDLLISDMLSNGLAMEDLIHLEKLSDQTICRRMPNGWRHPDRNNRDHLVAYMTTWADMLEEQLLPRINVKDATATKPKVRDTVEA